MIYDFLDFRCLLKVAGVSKGEMEFVVKAIKKGGLIEPKYVKIDVKKYLKFNLFRPLIKKSKISFDMTDYDGMPYNLIRSGPTQWTTKFVDNQLALYNTIYDLSDCLFEI